MKRERAVIAIRFEMLRPTLPTALVDWPVSVLGDSLVDTSTAGIKHLYLNSTFDAEKGAQVRRVRAYQTNQAHMGYPLM